NGRGCEDGDPEHDRLMQSYEERKRFAEEVNRSGRLLGALERAEKPILFLSSKDDDETEPKQEKPKRPKK
ncbi:MAG: hypothetical protein KAJ12_01570, partial [Bacteroidetes bacterium]|nr:hypothetical protein [Bacteroidota bacterium]